jgi:hypothetical protein
MRETVGELARMIPSSAPAKVTLYTGQLENLARLPIYLEGANMLLSLYIENLETRKILVLLE